MAWLDDRLWCHPKITNVPREARWEYTAAVTYSAGFGTGGHLTAGQLAILECTPADRKALIKVGLWDDAGDGAIRIHDWDEHNGKRDKRRADDRERKRRNRAKDHSSSAGQVADTDADNRADGSALKEVKEVKEVTDEGQDHKAAAGVQRTSSTTKSHYAETDNPENSAAAVESPTESDIRDACTRFGADISVVEPLARQLPGAVFAAIVMKHTAKVARGSAREVPALFVRLLQAELKDQAKAIARQPRVLPPTRLPEDERPKPQTGEDWVRTVVPTLRRHPFERVAELVAERGAAEAWTANELNNRLTIARELH